MDRFYTIVMPDIRDNYWWNRRWRGKFLPFWSSICSITKTLYRHSPVLLWCRHVPSLSKKPPQKQPVWEYMQYFFLLIWSDRVVFIPPGRWVGWKERAAGQMAVNLSTAEATPGHVPGQRPQTSKEIYNRIAKKENDEKELSRLKVCCCLLYLHNFKTFEGPTNFT